MIIILPRYFSPYSQRNHAEAVPCPFGLSQWGRGLSAILVALYIYIYTASILQLRYKLVHLWSSATAAKVNIWQFFAWNCVDAAVHVAETPIQGQLLENNGDRGGGKKTNQKFVARIIKGIDAWNRNRGCPFPREQPRLVIERYCSAKWRVRTGWYNSAEENDFTGKRVSRTRHSFPPIPCFRVNQSENLIRVHDKTGYFISCPIRIFILFILKMIARINKVMKVTLYIILQGNFDSNNA